MSRHNGAPLGVWSIHRDGKGYPIVRRITSQPLFEVNEAWTSKYQDHDLDSMSKDPWIQSVDFEHSGYVQYRINATGDGWEYYDNVNKVWAVEAAAPAPSIFIS